MKRFFLFAGCIAPAASTYGPAGDSTKPSHKEVRTIGADSKLVFGKLSALCMSPGGPLLACDSQAQDVKVIDLNSNGF